jgi:hypothetical protein
MHGDTNDQGHDPPLPPEERERRNRSMLFSFALVCIVIGVLVSGLPDPLVPAALDQLFGLASLGASLVALLWREPLFADHLTHWDKAAVLIGLSIIAGFYTDPVLVEQTLDAMVQTDVEAASSFFGEPTSDLAAPDAGSGLNNS